VATKIAVMYYSATGSVYELARAVVEGAASIGTDVRVRRVRELAPPEAIAQNPAWQAHHDATRDTVETAALDAFGTPTRFGNPTAQLKEFIDSAGGLWPDGKLTDTAATTFTSAMNRHGGQESTLLALNNVFYHWRCILVPPGYTDDSIYAAGGNPYGVAWPAGQSSTPPDDAHLAAARHQGRRLAEKAALLHP
jgi:NAD(P)H dehydrogenase (quinone)